MLEYYPFQKTPLPYDYAALEPYLDAQTVYLHHDKHLASYIDQLNSSLHGRVQLQKLSLEQLVCLGERLPQAVARSAGGVYNHRFYFAGVSPQGGGAPVGTVAARLSRRFGSLTEFYRQFKEQALAVFGSGYLWLTVNKHGQLALTATANQDTPLAQGECPLLTVDLWEHAYYLKHYNERANYLEDWLAVVDWPRVEERWRACMLK